MFVTQAYHPVVWGVIVQDSLQCIHAATNEDAQELLFDHLKLESPSLMFVATYVFSIAHASVHANVKWPIDRLFWLRWAPTSCAVCTGHRGHAVSCTQ